MAEPPTSTTNSGAAEPRALSAALSGPAFQTKNSGSAMHAATRHVERWAPEAGANRVRSLRNLGFVDRLVAPWLEVAQKSASMRLFQQYRSEGMAERETNHVSWVFPRPWYQDELDWMTASREAAARTVQQQQAAPTMFTTRGTFVPPAQRDQVALPGALYEHVAPSLSITPPVRNDFAMPAALASSVAPRTHVHDAYSPLVPFAAVNAAQVMQRAVAPLIGMGDRAAGVAAMSPGLRAVLTTMLERSVMPASALEATRAAANAPELVTPPAPRADQPDTEVQASTAPMAGVVQDVGAQRAQIAELQRAARVVAERQLAERVQQQGTQQLQARAQQAAAQAQAAERQRAADAASTQASASERSRVEDRIAQRTAERQAQVAAQTLAVQAQQVAQTQQRAREQRLHEAAREAAARDASVAPTTTTVSEHPAQVEQRRVVPQEITAALANLSPQLASVVATNLAQHPERMAQTIGELGEALRNAELIARNAAAGGSFEQTRGPRLVMPAGLGGLVATVDHNVAQSEHRAQGLPFAQAARPTPMTTPATMPMIAPRPTFAPALAAAAQAQMTAATASAMRMPAIAWLAAPGSPAAQQVSDARGEAAAPATALAAAEASRPAALQHVAWADRWLARFSGAKEASLDLLTASSASPATRLQALADAAPGTVFVSPQLDHSVDDSPAAVARREAEAPVYAPPVRRYDDNEATPDDVLIAISRQAARARTPVASVPELVTAERASLADAVAHTVPVAPNAGLSAQLASSPFAPAFRHVFPLAAAPAFDVRALFGETLSAAYLAGMLTPAAREVVGGAAIGEMPGFAALAAATPFAPIAREAFAQQREPFDFAAEYVAPTLPAAELAGESQDPVVQSEYAQAQAARAIEPLTTMRSALLAWNVESIVTPQATAPAMAQASGQTTAQFTHELRADMPQLAASAMTAVSPELFAAYVGGTSAAVPAGSIGHDMIGAMSSPMIGESTIAQPGIIESAAGESRVPSFAAPGMIADRAQTWSVAQERSAADLSFDFVTPELVLAARVYGLGPAEAAQAMRLAIAGPSQLAAMASTVNRTFVQAMAIEAARTEQGGATAPITAYPTSSSLSSSPAAVSAGASYGTAAGTLAGPFALPTASATFGVERKTPRGAFMWPSATVAALGLSAAAPDGDQGMPVAALELLAAQSVAALGTYAALGFGMPAFGTAGEAAEAATPAAAAPLASAAPAMTSLAPSGAPSAIPGELSTLGDPSEADVLTSATSMVGTSRRAKFEAMYVALGQSAQARSWSPAARAARALALAGRGDESITALERAQIAWSVLPLVAPTAFSAAIGGGSEEPGAVQSTGSLSQRAAMRRHVELQQEQLFATESRPGLANLSSRAGEALGSYVAPSDGKSASASSSASSSSGGSSTRDREHGAMLRAPSAAPDYVRTGSVGGVRSTGRFGGGEVEVPTWFEAAARKMLDERSSGMSSDISLAELTLVQAAPTTHIAASERGVQSAAPAVANPSSTGAQQSANQQIDIEKVANEVYKHILTLMDAARARNGEPYL